MPISTCPSRYQFPPHTAATFLPLLAPSFTQQYTNQKCASIASTITPHSLPRQVLHSEYVLSPEILTAIRAIPTSLLLATLEKGQSVFRRASPVPSFTLVPERLSEIGAPPYDPCTELRNMCAPNSHCAPLRPLLQIPLFPSMTFISTQLPPS